MITLFRRELSAYFQSAIATIFLIVFVVFANGLFMLQFFQMGKVDLRPFFYTLPFTLNLFIPALAMRLWAEDRKSGTFELLLTFPVRPQALVLGKYLAALVFYLMALSSTFTLPLMLSWLAPVDPGPVIGGYIGAALLGAFYLAVGAFLSALCKDQIVAFVLTAVSTFFLFYLGTDLFAAPIDGWAPPLGTFLKEHLGAASHLGGFTKGVLDLHDTAYFLTAIALLLFLNGSFLGARMRQKAKWILSAATVLGAALFILLNVLWQTLPQGRFDLTEGRIYTVSDVTKRILSRLPAPVEARLYITPAESMPTALKSLQMDITDKLEELRLASDGKFSFRVVNPDLSSKDEALMKEMKEEGITPFQVESIRQDEVGMKLIFSTLILKEKEKREILPRLVPQALGDLEYQLLSRIHKMTLESPPRVAVFAPVEGRPVAEEIDRILAGDGKEPEKTYEDDFKTATLLIRNNGYQAARVALTKEDGIPEGTKLLLLLAPGVLSDEQKGQIERFLTGGGTVVVAAQPYKFSYVRGESALEAAPQKQAMDINTLLKRWGVQISEDILLDESSQVISLTSGQRIGPFALEMPVKLPNQIHVRDSQINRQAPLTKRLPSVAYLWGSALTLDQAALEAKKIRSTVLFTSSPRSWTIPLPGNLTEGNTRAPQEEIKGNFPLAVMLEGTFGESADSKPGRLLVIGCSRAFSEELIQTPGNLNLFANIVDGLVLGEEMLLIRTKAAGPSEIRPLSNAEKLGYRFFTVLLIPGLLLGASLIRHFVRRKEKEFYLASLRSVRS